MRENELPGTTVWQNTFDGNTEGYTSESSVLPGQVVHFHISARPASRYRIEIYRLGWYGGKGGRLVGCVPGCQSDRAGIPRPVPAPDPRTGMVRARWPVTDTLRVPGTWVSGLYVGRVLSTTGRFAGKASAVGFVVRGSASTRSTILVNLPVATGEAYNPWGGKSLYTFDSRGGVAANHVSFDRPSTGAGAPIEYPILRYLEQQGYDVSYTTDVDIDLAPAQLLRHTLVLVAGHDEYWSKTMRDAFERARNSGVNLAFFGADIGNWQIRFADHDRTIIEYRDPALDPEPNPALKTTKFTQLVPPRPECTLLGEGFVTGSSTATLKIEPAGLRDRWMKGTGFTRSSTFKTFLGEGDGVVPGCDVPPLTVFWSSQQQPGYAAAVRYMAPSGSRVFSVGSYMFNTRILTGDFTAVPPTTRGSDPRMQKFVAAALAELTRKH